MKRGILCMIVLLLAAVGGNAQKLIIGEKAPEIKVVEWLGGKAPVIVGKAMFVDFFHSSNPQCVTSLDKINALHKSYGTKMNFIILSKEGMDKMISVVNGKGYGFFVGIDEGGKTFSGYDVRFVPFSVLIDTRGRLVWTGNVTTLSDDIVEKAMK